MTHVPCCLVPGTKSSPGSAEGEQDSGAAAGRKRRWGSSTAVTAKKPSISITTDSLKVFRQHSVTVTHLSWMGKLIMGCFAIVSHPRYPTSSGSGCGSRPAPRRSCSVWGWGWRARAYWPGPPDSSYSYTGWFTTRQMICCDLKCTSHKSAHSPLLLLKVVPSERQENGQKEAKRSRRAELEDDETETTKVPEEKMDTSFPGTVETQSQTSLDVELSTGN